MCDDMTKQELGQFSKNQPGFFDPGEVMSALAGRSIVLVGLMGAGKSTIGKQLAFELGLQFLDGDYEIEVAAQMSIADIFALYGEGEFRRLEQRVIARCLLTASTDQPIVLATGGGAFMNDEIRTIIARHAISIWLEAPLDLLMERVLRKNTRPLLQNDDPRGVMQSLMTKRYPIYALADITVPSRDAGREDVTQDVLMALVQFLENAKRDF